MQGVMFGGGEKMCIKLSVGLWGRGDVSKYSNRTEYSRNRKHYRRQLWIEFKPVNLGLKSIGLDSRQNYKLSQI